jgi:hypothetical protein
MKRFNFQSIAANGFGVSGLQLSMLAALLLLGSALESKAYPPAPPQIFYGLVRDEMGNPLRVNNATVILQTTSGVKITGEISPTVQDGANYKLSVPMDAGVTSDVYQPTALDPAMPFTFRVQIGSTTYLPIEVKSDFALKGKPAARTRLDLTLGEDSDGDGLPDAWERALLAARGGGDLRDINPGDDFDKDGLSNLQEYVAGTYAFDPSDSFELKMVALNNGAPVLEFMAIKGRNYSVLGTKDLQTWEPLQFRISGSTDPLNQYFATDVRVLRIEVVNAPASVGFFKLLVR